MKVCISDRISPQGAAGRKIAFDNVHAEHPKAQAGDNNSTGALLALNDDTVLGVNRDSQLTYRGGDQQCAAIPRAQLSSGPEWRRSNRSAAASIVGIPNGHTAGAECTNCLADGNRDRANFRRYRAFWQRGERFLCIRAAFWQ